MPLLEPALLRQGYVTDRFAPALELEPLVRVEDWTSVDAAVGRLVLPGAPLFLHMSRYHTFEHIEYILSIRDSAHPDQEDGIWHDDGSRRVAFTLSLTLEAQSLEGGRLSVRRKGEREGALLPTPPFGEMLVYLTGCYGFEHKIHQVTRGRRVVIAGWCWEA